MTKISIITVVFNGAKTLDDTIKSVLSQRDITLEYIIVDGASTDGTLKIIETNRAAIHHFVSEPDEGIYDAMNKGLKLATGDIIGFLNADDIYWDSDALFRIVKAFEANKLVEIVYGDLVYVEAESVYKTVRTWTSKSYYPRFFEDGHVPPHPSFFAKKIVYQESGVFDTSFRFAADYELMFRFLKMRNHLSFYLAGKLVKMRLGGTTNRSFSNILKGNREIDRIWKVNGFPPSLLFWLKRYGRKIQQFF